MKRATFFKSSGGSISLSSGPSADPSREPAKAGGRQSIRGRISAPIPFLDSPAPTGPAPTPISMAAAEPSGPASLPIPLPVASPATEAASAKAKAAAVNGESHHADEADFGAAHDIAYDADLDDADKGKALDEKEEKDGMDEDGKDEKDEPDNNDKTDKQDEVVLMASSPEPMPPLHAQKRRLAAMSPAGHRRVQTLDTPTQQQPTTTLQHPSNTLRYSTASGASGTATSENTANSSPKPQRKKSTLRGALSKLFGRKKMGMMSMHGHSQSHSQSHSHSQNNPHSGYQKTDSYMPTIDDHYGGDYEKELERGPNHRSVRSDPTVLSMPRGESKRSASASLPISEFDRALRSHSVGPDDMVAIENARDSLAADRVASITNMSNLSNLSSLSNLSHVASLDGGRRLAGTGTGTGMTQRVSLYPSQSLSQPLQARRRFGNNNSAEVLGGSEWTGLSPRPASAHGRGLSRLSSYSHSHGHGYGHGHGLSASTSHATPRPAGDVALATATSASHMSRLSSTSMSASRHDPSEIGRAITSDAPGLEADTRAQRRRSRSLSGLAEIALDGVQARRRSDEIRYWRESYDPAYQSSRHGDDEDDMDDEDDEYDGEGEDIHDEYTRPNYEGDDESEEDSDVDGDEEEAKGEGEDENEIELELEIDGNKAHSFQQRNSLSNVIHASKLKRILQAQTQTQTQTQTQSAEKPLQPTPGKPAHEFLFATSSATTVNTHIPRPVSNHSVKAITILSTHAANSMNSMNAGGGSGSGNSSSSSHANAASATDRTDARLGGLETRMNRMESVVDQLCHSMPGFKSASQSQSQSQSQSSSTFPFDAPRSVPASTSSPYAYATNQSQPAVPPIPAMYQSQVAQVQSPLQSPSQSLSQSLAQYSMSRRSFDLDHEQEHDGDQDDEMDDGQTYIGSIPPSSSATQAPSMLASSGPFSSPSHSHSQAPNHPPNNHHSLNHYESTASLQTANLLAQLESERAVRQTLETQVKKLNERVNMLSTTMYAMLRDPAAAAAAASRSAKSMPSPQSPRRSPSSASVAASIAAAQLKADTVIQTAKALGHGTPRDANANNTNRASRANRTNSHTFSVESGGITPKGFIQDASPSEYYYGNDNEAENDENEDPIYDSDSKRRKAARTLSLGQLTLGKSAVQ